MKQIIITVDESGKFSMTNTGFLSHELIGIGEIIKADSLKDMFSTKQKSKKHKDEPGTI